MNKKLVTIQDLSCFGQCSLTVALPVISALGVEAAVLPTSLLSNHTMFSAWTKCDLDTEVDKIFKMWQEQKISYDGLVTGYIGNSNLVNIICDNIKNLTNGKIIIDPAMADNGKLYPGFDDNYVDSIARLCSYADIILPNLSEACLLLGIEYKDFTEQDCKEIILALNKKFNCNVVLKGVTKCKKLGVMVLENGEIQTYYHQKMQKSYHGTGDIYASVFAGMLLNGYDTLKSASVAADFVVDCIKDTICDESHFYGVHFEKNLYKLGKYIK